MAPSMARRVNMQIRDLEAENERLREALRGVKWCCQNDVDFGHCASHDQVRRLLSDEENEG